MDAIEPPRVMFGDRLRRFRIARGLTLREFAEDMPVSAATLGRYEHDGGRDDDATRRLALLVSSHWGIDAQWLLTGVAGAGFEPATSGLRARPLSLIIGLGHGAHHLGRPALAVVPDDPDDYELAS